MTPISDERLADAEWLEHAARYFEKRGTGGEDMAFWANVANAERCRSIAQSLRAQGGVASLEASPAPVSEPTHRHKKRGTEYVLIGIGKMQAKWIERDSDGWETDVDMREVAIYRSATDPNEIWVRPLEEFNDGRFEALAAKGGQ